MPDGDIVKKDQWEQVMENATRFTQGADAKGKEMNERLSLTGFSHWYYFRRRGGFAPQKFIAHVGTTVENYNTYRQGNMGKALGNWFTKIDRKGQKVAFRRWKAALEEYAEDKFGIEINAGIDDPIYGGIYIFKDEFEELCREQKPNVWMVRASGGERALAFIENEYVGIRYGLEEFDMSACRNQEEVKKEYKKHNTRESNRSVGQKASQIWSFLTEVEAGDYVLTKDTGGLIHCGIVGEFTYVKDDHPCANRRPVSWVTKDIEESVLPGLSQKAVFKLNDVQERAIFDEIGRVDLLVDRKDTNADASTDPDVETESDVNPGLNSLADDLLLPLDFLEEIRTLLEEKQQVIFQGPPGTGKTYVARKLAKCLAGSQDRVTIVQFHPSYAYEDFVQGFRPTLIEGQASFKLNKGPLLKAAKRAKKEPDAKHFLIIDEINRGILAKVFGELYFLLEYRDEKIKLQYDREKFDLPENLYIIGTMNTADRSIALVDLALRRRFYFVSFNPHEPPVEGLLGRWLAKNAPDMEWVAGAVARANKELNSKELNSKELNSRHAAIGPSYFMKEGLDEDAVERIWKHSVMPYVEEHLFGEPDRLKDFELGALRKNQSGEDEDEDEGDGASAGDAAGADDDE